MGASIPGSVFIPCYGCTVVERAACEGCDHESKRDERERVRQLDKALVALLLVIRQWGAEEDGIPEEFYPSYVAACQLVDSRYCHVVRPGVQSCGSCMALSCGDNTNAEAQRELVEGEQVEGE